LTARESATEGQTVDNPYAEQRRRLAMVPASQLPGLKLEIALHGKVTEDVVIKSASSPEYGGIIL